MSGIEGTVSVALPILEGIVGVALVLLVFVDVFNGVVVPRSTARATILSRTIVGLSWRGWRGLGARSNNVAKREAMLGVFAPIILMTLLVLWVVLLVMGFGLLIHAVRGSFTPQPGILGSMYIAGSSLFGLGQSAFVPTGRAARVVGPIINASTLGIVALLITFLFSLFGNFQKREALVVTLDARAGAPPSGVTLLETLAQYQMVERLPVLFLEWERWAAEVLDSHLAYPILSYFRSSHDNESWISALGAVMDASTLTISTIDGPHLGPAKMMHAMGTHLVEDLAFRFKLDREPAVGVEREEYEDARQRLAAAGFSLKDAEASWAQFGRMRSMYATRLNAMANFWATPPAQWIGDRSSIWDRHARRRAGGAGSPAEPAAGQAYQGAPAPGAAAQGVSAPPEPR